MRHVYSDDQTWVVAESLEDAKEIFRNEDLIDEDDIDDNVHQCKDESMLSICEEEGSDVFTSKTCAEWAAEYQGKDWYLCSTEY